MPEVVLWWGWADSQAAVQIPIYSLDLVPTLQTHIPTMLPNAQDKNLRVISPSSLSCHTPSLTSKSRWLYLQKYPESDHFSPSLPLPLPGLPCIPAKGLQTALPASTLPLAVCSQHGRQREPVKTSLVTSTSSVTSHLTQTHKSQSPL